MRNVDTIHRPSFCLVLILLLLETATSQLKYSIRGRVLDRETGEPIPSVNILVRGEKVGTFSDTSGYFKLQIPTSQSRIVVFSHVAYRKIARAVAFDSTFDMRLRIYLDRDTIPLKEVVIVANKQRMPTEAAEKTALYSISGDEFERIGEEDMERALAYLVPGVVARREVRMLRDSSDFTLYLNGEFKESLSLDEINPFTIKRVKVWGYLGYFKDIDVFPVGFPLLRGRYVVMIETRQP